MSLSSSQRRIGRWVVAVAVVGPTALLGMGAMAVFGGNVGQVVPMLLVGGVVAGGVLMLVSATPQTRTAVREVFCGLLAVVSGAGAWLSMLAVGIGIGAVPFMFDDGSYPYAGAWMALTFTVGIVAVPLAWWLLRRAITGHPSPRQPARVD